MVGEFRIARKSCAAEHLALFGRHHLPVDACTVAQFQRHHMSASRNSKLASSETTPTLLNPACSSSALKPASSFHCGGGPSSKLHAAELGRQLRTEEPRCGDRVALISRCTRAGSSGQCTSRTQHAAASRARSARAFLLATGPFQSLDSTRFRPDAFATTRARFAASTTSRVVAPIPGLHAATPADTVTTVVGSGRFSCGMAS